MWLYLCVCLRVCFSGCKTYKNKREKPRETWHRWGGLYVCDCRRVMSLYFEIMTHINIWQILFTEKHRKEAGSSVSMTRSEVTCSAPALLTPQDPSHFYPITTGDGINCLGLFACLLNDYCFRFLCKCACSLMSKQHTLRCLLRMKQTWCWGRSALKCRDRLSAPTVWHTGGCTVCVTWPESFTVVTVVVPGDDTAYTSTETSDCSGEIYDVPL